MRSVFDKEIGNAKTFHFHRKETSFLKEFKHCTPEPSLEHILFNRKNSPGLLGPMADEVPIQRL